MDRAFIEAKVQHIYSVRKCNDAALAADLFAPDATFELSGSGGPGRVAAQVSGAAGIAEMMSTLVSAWEWLDHEFLDVLIDGDRAAVRYRTKQRFIPTNQIVTTDLYDLVTFRDGKILNMIEFCDTALASDLILTAMNSAARQGR